MFVNINELICFIDNYSFVYFNEYSYQFIFECELKINDEKEKLLLVPKIDEILIIKDYIEKNKIPEKHRNNCLFDISKFHRKINNLNLYDDWISFRREKLLSIATDWCEMNSINYSLK